MAKFCSRCGTALHPEFGICPTCEKELIHKMESVPNFCRTCGGKVDKQKGICTGCGHNFLENQPVVPAAPVAAPKKKEVTQPVSKPAAPIVQEKPKKPAPQPPKPKKQKRKRKGSIVITIVLCILLFIFTFSGAMLYSARSMATDENKIEMLMDSVTVSEFLDLMGEDYKQAFYDALRDFVKEKTGATLTPRKLDELAERSSIKSEISKQLALYVSDIVEDESNFNLKRKNIESILKKNRSAVEKVLEAEVSDEVLETIAKWLVDDAVMDAIRPSAIKENQPLIYYSINIALSWLGIVVFLLLMALCIFLLACNNPSQAATGSGLVFIIVGGLTTIAAAATLLAPSLMMSFIPNHLIASAINVFFGSNLPLFAGILVIGIAVLIVKTVVRRMLAKREVN